MKEYKRPVKCIICNKQMYYFNHKNYEEERKIIIENEYNIEKIYYAHLKCIKKLKWYN